MLLHRQIGESLERLYGASDAHLPELAHHFYQAAPGGDVQKAVDYAKRAGDRASDLFAFEEAASQYELAIQALELQSQPDAQQQVELLLALSGAHRRAEMPDESVEAARRAASVAEVSALRICLREPRSPWPSLLLAGHSGVRGLLFLSLRERSKLAGQTLLRRGLGCSRR